jgi:hypothetical protein
MNDFHLVCSIYFYTKTLSGNFVECNFFYTFTQTNYKKTKIIQSNVVLYK